MATELTMPQMGYDMHEGTVVRWLKAEGASVEEGEPLAEIETDKAVVEFESYATGVLETILVPEGVSVPVGQPIAIVGEEGAPLTSHKNPESYALADEVVSTWVTPVVGEPIEEKPSTTYRMVRASPVARRLAGERGIDLSQIVGTGLGDRITKEDVLAFAENNDLLTTVNLAPVLSEAIEVKESLPPVAQPVVASEMIAGRKVPLSRMRQQIARVTVKSKQEKPHFYVASEIDMTRAIEIREEINTLLTPERLRVSVNDMVVKACVEALKKYPKFNAYYHDDGIQMNEAINIGIAIDGDEGLIVPSIMDCGNRSLKCIANLSKDLAQRVGSGTLRHQEYASGTFTISNLGMFGVTSFVAIIHPPQSAVLAIGTVTKKPVVQGEEIIISQVMTATLSADHRIVDGTEAATFVAEIKRLLENPLSLLV